MSIPSIVVLCFVPALIVLLDRVERAFGSARAGWLASFPIVGGPALLIVTLQHGTSFGAHAARSALLGVVGWAGFLLCYRLRARAAPKAVAPAVIVAASFALSAGLGWILTSVTLPRVWPWLILIYVVLVGLTLGSTKADLAREDASFLATRTVLATMFTVTTVGASYVGGQRLAGLFTTFPIVSSSLLIPVFLKGRHVRTSEMVSGMLIAGPALAVFMASVAYFLTSTRSTPLAFVYATGLAVVVHVAMWSVLSRRSSPSRCAQ